MNVLDLSIFPSMSKHNGELLVWHSNTVAPAENIWSTAKQVWAQFDSASIARGFVVTSKGVQ
jgi:uncharacterized protein (DUF1330 family)